MQKKWRMNKFPIIFTVLAIIVLLAVACDSTQQMVETTPVERGVVTSEPIIEEDTSVAAKQNGITVTPIPTPAAPITHYGAPSGAVYTFDPQKSTDVYSGNYIENLFVHLTAFDSATAEILPEAATAWEISEDGLIYTFDIRTDIPWVYHNPDTGETMQEVDGDGNLRFVTAHDFVYSIKRACHPEHGSPASNAIAPLIKGCEELLYVEDIEGVSAEMIDAVGVSAPVDDKLIIELAEPAGFFLSMTPLSVLAAAPKWAIEKHGDDWVTPGLIVTSGNYMLEKYVPDIRTVLRRNPLMPEDMRGSGNIELFVSNVVEDLGTAYALWQKGEIEQSGIPEGEIEAHLANFPDEVVFIGSLATSFFGFRTDKPPFDNVDVRRAFSAAYDREAHVAVLLEGLGLPMIHLAPPGIYGAPPIDEVGVGTNIEYAQERLAAAGYPNCEGFPPVTMLTYDGDPPVRMVEFAQAQWSENLGCEIDLIQIQQLQFLEMITVLGDDDPTLAPHIFTLGWGADYADENNWVGDLLSCTGFNHAKRLCDEIDEMIEAARIETAPEKRIALYRQIEEAFFGKEGLFPIMPTSTSINQWARHTWLDSSYALIGGDQWQNWTIDREAQLAARGE
ncbi:MAG: peptide ABC transporter substrate-binding protein [Anaerolineae bacterium]|nr:peptide ABC transporter substrate-binding protein [Anaerolineae bacterium]MCO5194244.1 peptide ABC transporter substrate-binding protein [Anaerolineae bacterium]